MPIRDCYKKSDYFTQYIAQQERRIEKFTTKIAAGQVKKDRILPVQQKIFELNLDIVIANYSLGTEVIEIKTIFENLLDNIHITNLNYRYAQIVWLLSIAILLDVNNKSFDKIIDLVKRDKINDYLIDYLIKYRKHSDWNINTEDLKFDTPYQSLKEVIVLAQNDKMKALLRLKSYLENEWYQGHGKMNAGWCGSHKETKVDVYYGYWSFESAALANILTLDDSSFNNLKYYPYDMAHFGAKKSKPPR